MKYSIAIIFACMSGSAFAGCANFTDGSLPDNSAPVVRICYDDVCDITTQDYICSTMNTYHAGYAIGWSVDCTFNDATDQDCQIAWQGRAIDPAKHDRLTFTELDQ
ncbi:hypothetical protein SAMN05444287_1980 [Octadecabacter temperatus]|uniref:Uncharacterized protein n=1 Tax=Octadecabacter temperatus TaxID=1458307 RepID=A0A0K0Y7J7_9RHOB|nr:hypothetical protein [Octadecabacter temperatus]AKS46856.1 hypothetical protein OSB_23200 [Octadecabacter temperatus]SIO22575.1 hypothetical protein SAMN05444287_1980 [Octadecabacter temperatus]